MSFERSFFAYSPRTNLGIRAERLFYSTEATKSDAQPTTSAKTANKDTEMASDEDYAAFLDKANEDPNAGVSKTQSSGKIQLKAVDHGAEVPAVLKKVTKDAFYVSDADEPFEPVCLKLGKGKGLPDEGILLCAMIEQRMVFEMERI